MEVLRALDYVQAGHRSTPKGVVLQGMCNGRDLLAAECVQYGLFTDSTVSELAGALAVCISRNHGGGPLRLIPANASLRPATALEATVQLNLDLA